jgi:hypothetical protein
MARSRIAIVGLWICIVLGLFVLFWGVRPMLTKVREKIPISNTPVLLRQIQSLGDLVTVKYVMEKVVLLEDVKWYGESRVLMVAHGVVKAGVNLQKISQEHVRIEEGKVVIKLPPPEITDVYLDDEKTQVIERTTGVLRSFDKDLEQNARRQAVDSLRRAARYGGIQKDADERARQQLTHLFQVLGYSKVEFEAYRN